MLLPGVTKCNFDGKILHDCENSGVKSCLGKLVPLVNARPFGRAETCEDIVYLNRG